MSNTNPFTSSETKEVSIITPELNKHEIVGLSAKAIEQAFAPMVARLQEIESEFYAITQKQISDETIAEAKELRQRMVKIRTSTAAVHKEQKAESLRKGKAIDGIKNILEAAIVDKEIALSKIEKHFINIEVSAKQKIWNERFAIISPFIGDAANTIPLADLNQEVFDNMVHGYKLAAEEKARLERKAELDRKEAEEKKALEDKRIREENEVLKKQNDLFVNRAGELMQNGAGHTISEGVKGFELIRLRDSASLFIPEETIRKSDDDFFNRKIMSAVEEYSEDNKNTKQIAWEAEQKKIKATEEKLKKEREERKRLETEQREREEKEQQERKQKAAEERKAKRAPDKVKLLTLADQIESLPLPDLNNDESKLIRENAKQLLIKVVDYIRKNTNNL